MEIFKYEFIILVLPAFDVVSSHEQSHSCLCVLVQINQRQPNGTAGRRSSQSLYMCLYRNFTAGMDLFRTTHHIEECRYKKTSSVHPLAQTHTHKPTHIFKRNKICLNSNLVVTIASIFTPVFYKDAL